MCGGACVGGWVCGWVGADPSQSRGEQLWSILRNNRAGERKAAPAGGSGAVPGAKSKSLHHPLESCLTANPAKTTLQCL